MISTNHKLNDPEYLEDVPAGMYAPQADDLSLKVAVIGAGIAGLAAAAGLIRSGHEVEIFERSRFSNEVGAAINVCPNASRVLRHWDFNFQKAKAVPFTYQKVMAGDSLDVHVSADYSNYPEKYGSPVYFLHRVDLHNGLKMLALDDRVDYAAAKLHLASEVVDMGCESGRLTLADGKTLQKDLIVVADGVHSGFVRKIIGQDTPAEATGESAFRFLIPTEKLLASPATKRFFEDARPGMEIATLGDRRLVWYPCRSGELINFVGIHKEAPEETSVEDWNVEASLDRLLKTYESFNPAVVDICKQAEDLKLWKLLFRPPLPQWSKGKVVLIGDAAHPMLPHQGQGGGQAIEDAGALGALLSHVKSSQDIPERLEMFFKVRRNRTAAMQMFSNAGQDQAHKIQVAAQPFVDGPVPRNPPEFHDYNFGYNVFRECNAELSRKT